MNSIIWGLTGQKTRLKLGEYLKPIILAMLIVQLLHGSIPVLGLCKGNSNFLLTGHFSQILSHIISYIFYITDIFYAK